MTSYFARHYGLSQETHEAALYGAQPRNVNDRLDFYLKYLKDVVPDGVRVRHIPASGILNSTCEEIHLLTRSEGIFMTGLVRRDRNHHRTERVAADEAYSYYLDGEFVPDGDNWRFFTCHDSLRFFNSEERDHWNLAHCFRPMERPFEVAQFLQEEYDCLRFQ